MAYIEWDMPATRSGSSRTDKFQRLFELAAGQAGYFTAAQARGVGYSARSLVHHVAAGHVEREDRGPDWGRRHPREDIVAAGRSRLVTQWCRMTQRSRVSWRLPVAEIHLLPRGQRPRTAQSSLALAHDNRFVRRDEVTTRFGVQLTSPTRTIADIAEIGADPSVVIAAAGRAIATGLASPRELRAAVKRRRSRPAPVARAARLNFVRDYATPAAFRAAVEARLRERAQRLSAPVYIVRRQAALERLLVRLTTVARDRWALKGGLALETRLGERAVGLAVRYKLESSLAGRPFEPLQVDVTIAPPDPWDAQPLRRPGLLTEVGLGPVNVLLIPIERQVAEKLRHAICQSGGLLTRDLVDLLLIRQHEPVDPGRLREAVRRTFDQRAPHAVPERRAPPAAALAVAYRREARSVSTVTELEEAHQLLAQWLDPVLAEIHRRG
jgi:hypothetical protein